jgi:two-component sensor histidine kinase
VLDRLLHELSQATGGHRLVSAIDDARLGGRQTTTLALVTNELVSNALKHGKGQTEITFTTNGNNATLAVCDDGPGFPAGFDARTAANTGLELVENIVQWDLRGQIAYDNRSQGGAQITVTFPLQTHQEETNRKI